MIRKKVKRSLKDFIGQKDYELFLSTISRYLNKESNLSSHIAFDSSSVANDLEKIILSDNPLNEKDLSNYIDNLKYSENTKESLKKFTYSLNKRIKKIKSIIENDLNSFNKVVIGLCAFPFILLFIYLLFEKPSHQTLFSQLKIIVTTNYEFSFSYILQSTLLVGFVFLIYKIIEVLSDQYVKNVTVLILQKYLSRIVIFLLLLACLLIFITHILPFFDSSDDYFVSRSGNGIFLSLCLMFPTGIFYYLESKKIWDKLIFKSPQNKINLAENTEFLRKLCYLLGEKEINGQTIQIANLFTSIILMPEEIAKRKIEAEVNKIAKCQDEYKGYFIQYLQSLMTDGSQPFKEETTVEIKQNKKNTFEKMISFFKGEYNLFFSFWIIFVPIMLVNGYFIGKFYYQIFYHSLLKDIWFYLFIELDFLLRLYLYIAIWNSASNYKGKKIFRFCTKTLIVLLLIVYIYFNVDNLFFLFS